MYCRVHQTQSVVSAQHCDPCVLTNEDWTEEKSDGDVDNRGRHVQKPVGSHGKESQEEQKEEQTVLILLNLADKGEMLEEMLQSIMYERTASHYLFYYFMVFMPLHIDFWHCNKVLNNSNHNNVLCSLTTEEKQNHIYTTYPSRFYKKQHNDKFRAATNNYFHYWIVC